MSLRTDKPNLTALLTILFKLPLDYVFCVF